MNTVIEPCTPSKIAPTSLRMRQLWPALAILARAAVLLFIVVGIGNLAEAQSLGFVVNSTDATVTVFGNATTTLDNQPFSEDTLALVGFLTQTGQSPASPVATAVAPASGNNSPPSRYVYVTDQQNNQLWSFDISSISSQVFFPGTLPSYPVSIVTGSCSAPLFNRPGAIVIATPGSSVFAYVANQGNGTVSIINLATLTCVAQTAALGTITGVVASPDMNEVFVLATNVGTPPAPALWVIDTTATPQAATQINMSPFKMVDPVSIAVQSDTAACYFITIGDSGNSSLFLAAVGPAAEADPNCPAGVTPTTAQPILSPSEPSIVLTGSNPVSQVSTFAPGPNIIGGNIYVADSFNNEVWEIDCFVPNAPPVYSCNTSDSGPVTLTNGATPTTIGISLAQLIPANITAAKHPVKRVAKHATTPPAEEDLTYQYVYVAGTLSTDSVFDYSNVFSGGVDALEFFTTSAVTLGNGPQALNFSGADPSDPPVTWFMTQGTGTLTNGGAAPFQGPVWVMPVNATLTALGATVVNLNLANAPTFSLNFGTTAVNGLFGSATIYCAPFGGGTGETDCPGDAGVQGANALGGNSATSSGGAGGSLNLPASTVFTVTLEACSATCDPNDPNGTTVLSQQINAGAVCTLALAPLLPDGLPPLTFAVGQTVDAELTCYAPVGGANAPVGDGITATITWAPGVTGTVSCTSTTCTLSAPVNGYQYENAAMLFPGNSYSAAGTYTISVTGTDTTENVPIFLTGTSGSQTITVVGPTVTLAAPTGTASQPLGVLLSGTQAFSGVVNNAASTPTVTWTLTSGGTACSPACGTMSDETVTPPITGMLNYGITATYTAPAAVFAGTITLTASADGASAQGFLMVNGPTISLSPTGTASAPLPVQLLGTEGFAGIAGNSTSTPTVAWTLTSGGSACSPACGTMSKETVSSVGGTPNYNISATYTAPAELFTGTITLTVSANGLSAQAFIMTTTSTTTPPPTCSFSTPPTTAQTGLAVTVTLACTGPANDSLSATVDFSDSTPVTMTGTIIQSGTLTLTFTHTYANTGTYPVSITSIADTTSGLFGTPPAAISIIVYLTPTITPVQSSVTLAPGQSETFALNFAGGLGDANVTFTNFACQNLPTGATCTFSPTSITLDANGNSTNTLLVTVALAAPTSSRVVPPGSSRQILLAASLWGLPLFGIVFLAAGSGGKGQKRRRHVGFGLLLILVLVLMWLPACSSVTQSNTACPSCAAPGSYPVTVTGSSTNPALQGSTVFTLVVEP
jgi:hypothetical protein